MEKSLLLIWLVLKDWKNQVLIIQKW